MSQSGNILATPTTSRFRDMSDAISATWLNGPVGQRFRYSMAVIYDALADAAGYAVILRFPLKTSTDGLPLIGGDRQILRGPTELDASYANRLVQWLDLWRAAGNSMSVLLAVLSLFLPTMPRVRTVDNTSNWYSYDYNFNPFPIVQPLPTPPVYIVGGGNWNWDGNTVPWWRCWVIIYATNLGWTTGPKWGDGGSWGGPNRLWGIGGTTASFLAQLRQIIKQWKPAHAWVYNIVIALADNLFDPSHAQGGGINPDGTWGNPANRPANAIFLDGVV